MCRWIGAKRTEIPSTFFHIFSQLPILLLKTRTAKNLWECKKNMKFSLSFLWNVRKKAATITSWLGFERMKVSTWEVLGGGVTLPEAISSSDQRHPVVVGAFPDNRPIGWERYLLHHQSTKPFRTRGSMEQYKGVDKSFVVSWMKLFEETDIYSARDSASCYSTFCQLQHL